MSIKEFQACGELIKLPDAHDMHVLCLGHAHAETRVDRHECPFCAEMTVRTLHTRISTFLNSAQATPPATVEPGMERLVQPRAVGPFDDATPAQLSHAHCSMGPPVSYSENSFCPSDEACELFCFGVVEEDEVSDNDIMSTAASGSGDWPCQESDAAKESQTQSTRASDSY